jgi:predicted alpha/beta superfamily hydrolase
MRFNDLRVSDLMDMKKIIVLVGLSILPFINVGASEQRLSEMPAYQMPGTQVIPIKDTQSNKQYELLIKLPEKYAENKDKKYPVIYFTDAVWHIELLSSASFFMMEDVILVGISWQKDVEENLKKEHGAHVSRSRDYSFKKSSNPERQAKYKLGQASNHLAFIRKDVFKFVESNYRTEPNNRTYFGFSAGGVFGTYALMVQADTFKNYILGSPSIRRGVPELFAQEHAALKSEQSAINVFISYGELEKELSPHIEDFISQLKSKKYKGLSSIKHIVVESSGHSDSSPLMAMHSLKWLKSLQPKEDK